MNRRWLALGGLALVAIASAVSRVPQPAAVPARAVTWACPAGAEECSATPDPRGAIDTPAVPGVPPAPPAPAKAARYSAHRDVSPLDEIDRTVELSTDQRGAVGALVAEREALMHATYAEAVAEREEREEAIASVTVIYLAYDERIRVALTPGQQVRYDEGRREGRIGRPMFIFRYGGE